MILNYNWSIKEAIFTKDKGKVFSCFSGTGGSTMGYKLAGFDVIACNELDIKMYDVYVKNHNPEYGYNCDIKDLIKRTDLPKDLYNLDILDGSPPCSSFSMAGNRSKDWGKEKKFREGQKKQILDTLFFDFIELSKKLKPKVVVAENVKGLLKGTAIEYVKQIYNKFDEAGYYCQHFIIDSSKLGVPQKRERIFFICIRKELATKFIHMVDMFTINAKINLLFNEKPILFENIKCKNGTPLRDKMYPCHVKLYNNRIYGDKNLSDANKRIYNKNGMFNTNYAYDNKILGTLTAHKDNSCYILFTEGRYLNKEEWLRASSFPYDFDFLDVNIGYAMGMSVPPLMIYKISSEIYKQWLSKI